MLKSFHHAFSPVGEGGMTLRKLLKLLAGTVNILNSLHNRTVFAVFGVRPAAFPEIHGRIFIRNTGEIQMGRNVTIRSSHESNPIGGGNFTSLVVRRGGRLVIGDRVGISNTAIYCIQNIEIGDGAMIGSGCRIWDTDFHSLDPAKRVLDPDPDIRSAPVQIGRNAFIGSGSVILKGVSIGEASVVGAGSVVTKCIPDGEIWAGNPARFIRSILSSQPGS